MSIDSYTPTHSLTPWIVGLQNASLAYEGSMNNKILYSTIITLQTVMFEFAKTNMIIVSQ